MRSSEFLRADVGRPLARAARRASQSFDRLPIRVRLAGASAALTFVILCAFALAIGSLTVARIRADFNREVSDKVEQLSNHLSITLEPLGRAGPFGRLARLNVEPKVAEFAPQLEHAVIRIFSKSDEVFEQAPAKAPWFGAPEAGVRTLHDYRVVAHTAPVRRPDGLIYGTVIVQYARSVQPTEATVRRVELFLLLGVFAGTGLALAAGMMIARRAMAPITELTGAAAEIARTRDPSLQIPEPRADDEVAELARTLEGMLRELDAAREETEATLRRQRQFVADASHELRTPLTSVLANLELLAESLRGEEADAARSALRSSQRMRRLVADLLLLARRDAAQEVARSRVDLGRIVVEAAGELGPFSEKHAISLEVHPAELEGSRDELHRLAINLIENALRHTPAGTEIHVWAGMKEGGVVLVVEDNGPGIDPKIAPTLFERFVRGSGDRGGSFGLGLAIVQAIASSHGGSVSVEHSRFASGARFVVRLPGLSDLDDDGQHHGAPLQTLVDQLR